METTKLQQDLSTEYWLYTNAHLWFPRQYFKLISNSQNHASQNEAQEISKQCPKGAFNFYANPMLIQQTLCWSSKAFMNSQACHYSCYCDQLEPGILLPTEKIEMSLFSINVLGESNSIRCPSRRARTMSLSITMGILWATIITMYVENSSFIIV